MDGETFAGGHGEPTTQQGHLVAARHGHQEAAAALGQGRGELQPQAVVPHEGEVLRQPHQVGAAAGGQFDLLLGGGEIGVRIRRAGELHRCRQKTAHQITRQDAEL